MAISDKLQQILNIKARIRQALIDRGANVTSSTTFAQYPDLIYSLIAPNGKCTVTFRFDNSCIAGTQWYYSTINSLFEVDGTSYVHLLGSKRVGDNFDINLQFAYGQKIEYRIIGYYIEQVSVSYTKGHWANYNGTLPGVVYKGTLTVAGNEVVVFTQTL